MGTISFLIKSFFFKFIGLMIEPAWEPLTLGVALGVAAGVRATSTLPVIVFGSVTTTIVIFAVGFRLAGRSQRRPEPGPPAAPSAPS